MAERAGSVCSSRAAGDSAASLPADDGGGRQGFVDEIWACRVPARGPGGPVAPVAPGHGAGRPAGRRAVVAAAGRAEGRSEPRRQTEGGRR